MLDVKKVVSSESNNVIRLLITVSALFCKMTRCVNRNIRRNIHYV